MTKYLPLIVTVVGTLAAALALPAYVSAHPVLVSKELAGMVYSINPLGTATLGAKPGLNSTFLACNTTLPLLPFQDPPILSSASCPLLLTPIVVSLKSFNISFEAQVRLPILSITVDLLLFILILPPANTLKSLSACKFIVPSVRKLIELVV